MAMKLFVMLAFLATIVSAFLPFGGDSKAKLGPGTFFPTEDIEPADPRTQYVNLPLNPTVASDSKSGDKSGEKPKPKPGAKADTCCQICPNQFYQELSFLQLPHHVEAAAVARFKAWHAEVEGRRTAGPAQPARRQILGKSTASRRRHALHRRHQGKLVNPPSTGLKAVVSPPKCDFQGEPKFVKGSACCNICSSDHYKSEAFENIRYPPPAAMSAGDLAKYLKSKPAHEAYPCQPKYNAMPGTSSVMPCCGLCPKEFVPNVPVRDDEYGPPEADADGYMVDAPSASPALLELAAELSRSLDEEVSVRHAGKTAWHNDAATVLVELAGSTASLAEHAVLRDDGKPSPPGNGSCCIMCPANTYFNGPFDTPFGEPMQEGRRATFRNFVHRETIRDAKNKRSYDNTKTGLLS